MKDKVKAEIQELCPDVMELKFGCEIGTHVGGIKTCFVAGKQMNDWRCYAENLDGTVSFIGLCNFGKNFEILGSPITLAVVLRAIRKALIEQQQSHDIYQKSVMVIVGMWSEHDNYDQQSEECKQFLGTLLEVN